MNKFLKTFLKSGSDILNQFVNIYACDGDGLLTNGYVQLQAAA